MNEKTKSFEEWRLTDMFRRAGIENPQIAASAVLTGSSDLMRRAIERTVDALSVEKNKAEREAKEAKEAKLSELAALDRQISESLADPMFSHNSAPLLSRQELEAVYQSNAAEEPELSEEQLKQLEEQTARAMTLPGSDWRNYLD